MSRPTSSPLLEVSNLTHAHGKGDRGIFDISFNLFPGEFVLVAGRNGSGKTTLIRHLNGLLKPQKGQVRLKGKDIQSDLIHTRKTIGMVFQDADTQIIADTVFDEVAFGPENLKMDRDEITQRVNALLEGMDLAHLAHQNPALLSGGEKRRLTIAGILAMEPEIIVLDEPFANLDYPASQTLTRLLLDLNARGTTLIMVTHELEEMIPLAHRMLILSQGRLVADAPPTELLKALEPNGLKEPCFSKMGHTSPPW
ncbi:MAG: energy-coupling factor ABC transporter ATP-binding protein [Desulfobacterales bacterium]|nr:energy-coupling factor ABC transporter ATP-binding protein [Desulfobacterales bacterium]